MTELCWKPELVRKVINHDADFVPDSVFWAVDVDAPLNFKVTNNDAGSKVTTDELVTRFLDSSYNHYQLAVLGASGTGKSHLIHRMRQRIRDYPRFEVVAVRRLETNLRAIIQKLIDQLPTGQQEYYRAELDKAKPELSTPELQRSTLLDNLSQAIEEDFRRPDSGIDPEFEDELLSTLPNMFRDPNLRDEKFLAPGEIIPALVERLFSSKEGKRLEERLLFETSNLPLEGIKLTSCSIQARQAIDLFLYNSKHTVPSTLSVINRCLDRAIARALNFSGDQLGALMGEIREYLKSQDKELIILFEEFARLQGYDSAMLEALLVQGDESRCNVRWALACTTGRFREFPDTVLTRLNGIVDMDCSPPKRGAKEFAGRYLNAVRVGRDEIDRAFDGSSNDGVPNACEECPKQDNCKATFGVTEEGYSLYPFTNVALETMVEAVGLDFTTKFNPRFFQQKILSPILIGEADALISDEFPTETLVTGMDLPLLKPVERAQLSEMTGRDSARYEVFFQLWSGGRFQQPPKDVMRAFGLSPLKGLSLLEPEDAETNLDPDPPAPPNPRQNEVSESLDAWLRGEPLNQTTAQKIRTALFPLIERAIDWDAIGLAPSQFAAATKPRPFRNTSISFIRQATTGVISSSISIELPLQNATDGFNRAVIAFETLLNSTSDLEDGRSLYRFAVLSELVNSCADDIVKQLARLRGESTKWDPIPGVVELLLVGAALGGAMTATDAQSDEGLIKALFSAISQECPQTTGNLRDIYDLLFKERKNFQNLLRNHVSVTKGGQVGRFINPTFPLEAARLFRRRNWQLKLQPEDLPEPYKEVGNIYRKVQERLHSSLLQEQSERSCWLSEVEVQLGSSFDKRQINDAIDSALNTAIKGGLRGNWTKLTDAKEAFAGIQFSAAVEAAKRIRDANPPESALPHFARAKRNAVEATRSLIEQWDNFLSSAEYEVNDIKVDSETAEIAQATERLNLAFSALIDELSEIESSQDA